MPLFMFVWHGGNVIGRKSQQFFDDGFSMSFQLTKYRYVDEKIIIEATEGCNHYLGETPEKEVKIILSSLQEVVFDCYPKKNRLETYRSGKWEIYLFSMKDEAQSNIRRRNFQQTIGEERAQRIKFEPIDDSDLF